MDIRSLVEQFLKHLKLQNKSFNTIKNYKNDLACFVDYLSLKQGHGKLDRLDSPAVLEYGAYLDHKYQSENSRRRRVQALRLFFDFLVVEKLWPENPIRRIPTSPKKLDRPDPISMVDVMNLKSFLERQIKACEGSLGRLNSKRNLVIFHLVYGAGLKVSDMAALKKDHLLKAKDHYNVLMTPERRDPYSIPLPTNANDAIEDYLNDLNKYQKDFKFGFNQLLYNANAHKILSGGLSPRGLEVLFKSFATELDIKLTAKKLRQSCILKWINLDLNQSSIKERMGVKPSYSLKMYLEFYKDYKKECDFKDL